MKPRRDDVHAWFFAIEIATQNCVNRPPSTMVRARDDRNRGDWLRWIRVWLPTWRFFDRPDIHICLEYRTSKHRDGWLPLFFRAPRRWFHLFVNPDATWKLSAETELRRTLDELEPELQLPPAFGVSVDGGEGWIHRLIRIQIRDRYRKLETSTRFRLRVYDANDASLRAELEATINAEPPTSDV